MKVCIVGSSRCGTTLLRALLHEHPDLRLFNETHWLPKMMENFGHQKMEWRELLKVAEKTSWDTGRDLFDVNQEYSVFGSREALMVALRQALREKRRVTVTEFSEIFAAVAFGNPVYWGDKTPDYGFYMEQIQSLWPECRFIHIVRDGLVTARSMSRHPGCQLMVAAGYDNWCSLSYDHLYDKYPVKPSPMAEFIASWCRRMRRIRDGSTRLKKGSYLEISYEALLNSPDRALTRVTRFLGLSDDEDWRSRVASRVKSGKARPATNLTSHLPMLSIQDLRQLNSGAGQRYFTQFFGVSAACRLLARALRFIDQGDAAKAEHAILSVLANPAINKHPHGLRVAKRLLYQSLILQDRKDAAQAWAQQMTPALRDKPLQQVIAWLAPDISSPPNIAVETPVATGTAATEIVQASLKQLSPHLPKHPEGQVCVYACIRNEYPRLPHFLNYHRALGVAHFFIVDNNSDDGSVDFLLNQPDCTVFWTDNSYAASRCGVDWINALLNSYADGQWALVIDADELLVYPRCENYKLGDLIQYLQVNGHDALQTFMLDMYANAPLRDVAYSVGQSFIDACPYFDSHSYTYATGGQHKGVPVRGGVRKRLFWDSEVWRDLKPRGNPPTLMKTPLLRWRLGLSFKASTHLIDGLTRAELTGSLLHFKLFGDFYENVHRETERGEHWDGAAQYEVYTKVLQHQPELNPMYAGSETYRNSLTLVALGLMRMPPGYPHKSSPDTAASNQPSGSDNT